MNLTTPSLRNCLIALFLALATSVFAAEKPAWSPLIKEGDSLLFIGNSYMANEGGVRHYLTKALQSAKPPLKITTEHEIMYGKPLDVMFTPAAQEKIKSRRYDPVVITSGSYEAMKTFDAFIKANQSRTVIYMTWEGRHPGNRATMAEYKDATMKNVKLMRQVEKELGVTVVPLAVVYYDLTVRPAKSGLREDYMWRAGNIHQGILGTMVNTWTLYAVFTGQSPVGLDFDFTTPQKNYVQGTTLADEPSIVFDEALRRTLQERVWKIVQQWNAGKTELD